MFANANEQCQIAVELEKSSFIPLIINNFKKSMVGFNLKLEGDELVYHDIEIPVYSLPKTIRSCEEACNYVDIHNKIDLTKYLCKISANDNIVAISATHMLYDGGFFIDLFPKLTKDIDDENYLKFSMPRKVPYTPNEIFPNEFTSNRNMDELIHRHFDDLYHLRLRSKIDQGTDPECYITSHSYEFPASDYQFLRNGMSLTDMYWTFIPLCMMALFKKSE